MVPPIHLGAWSMALMLWLPFELLLLLLLMIVQFNCLYVTLELTPNLVADLFYNGEVEEELRRIGLVVFRFKLDADWEKCMQTRAHDCTRRRKSV